MFDIENDIIKSVSNQSYGMPFEYAVYNYFSLHEEYFMNRVYPSNPNAGSIVKVHECLKPGDHGCGPDTVIYLKMLYPGGSLGPLKCNGATLQAFFNMATKE
jgi:hypothetical protein